MLAIITVSAGPCGDETGRKPVIIIEALDDNIYFIYNIVFNMFCFKSNFRE
jgi:hypothetical protein